MGLFRRTTAALLIAVLGVPASALAQQGTPRPERTATVDQRASTSTDLPVSLDRIRRRLKSTEPRTRSSKDGLRLEYYVDVYGRAPRIELFLPRENITSTPVMYGGMTHQEFLQVVTPEEFKSPPADIGAAVAALVKWLSEKHSNSGQAPKK